MPEANWEAWEIPRGNGDLHHRDRFPLMRPVEYEMRIPIDEQSEEILASEGKSLSVNVSNGGMCLLMDRAPELTRIMRVQVPLSDTRAQTPTLAEVRWVRRLPFDLGGLYYVGLKFLL